ncbi:azurin [Idiomarina tyrosinivorans]|uniref:Azurin n=1 Tax=Idiomarina tyrosinivorans TaxID=1445662 RepID=A0A432ZSD4_9GAMM|nr:azurin [Idiomarina tyrosinivorans]RUO80835.1 azurin [Idiomarina tyrosinivorans]
MRTITRILVAVSSLLVAQTALADECELTITGNDMMRYDKTELSAPASCKEVTVTLKHSGTLAKSVMGHNWVLTLPEDMQSVVQSAMSLSLEENYIPDTDKIIAHTKVVGGGESDSVTFSTADLKAGKDYQYFCSFPGHSSMMKGTFRLTQ